MPRINLSQRFCSRPTAPPEGKRRIEHCDINLPGLYLEVKATSPTWGTFYLRYKDSNGKTCHMKLGRSTDISLKQARTAAKQMRAQIQLGADPRAEAKERKAVPTLADFLNQQYLPDSKRRKRSYVTDESIARLRIIPQLGSYRMNQISRKMLSDFHNGLLDEGLAPASCNHYLKLIRQAYNKAIEWEVVTKNPAAGMKLFHEDNQVNNSLNDEELTRLLRVLRTDKNRTVCNLCLFLLATGARKNEALHARWEHIDEDARVWHIPASNSKAAKARAAALNDTALQVLKKLRGRQRQEWLFISSQTGQRLTCINKVWGRLRKAAGLPNFRIHDLRHEAATALINSGRTLYEVQMLLGHSPSSGVVTQRYLHMSTKTMQEAANSIDDVLNRVGSQ